MAPRKGVSGNPSGISRGLAMSLKRLNGITPIAISRLGQLVQSENETVALGAIREVFDRAFGKARQQVSLEGKVEHSADAHLQALVALTSKAVPVLDLTANPNILEGNTNSRQATKLPLKSDATDAETVEAGDADSEGRDD